MRATPLLITYTAADGSQVRASWWCDAVGGGVWVRPIDPPANALVKIRKLSHRWVIDSHP